MITTRLLDGLRTVTSNRIKTVHHPRLLNSNRTLYCGCSASRLTELLRVQDLLLSIKSIEFPRFYESIFKFKWLKTFFFHCLEVLEARSWPSGMARAWLLPLLHHLQVLIDFKLQLLISLILRSLRLVLLRWSKGFPTRYPQIPTYRWRKLLLRALPPARARAFLRLCRH